MEQRNIHKVRLSSVPYFSNEVRVINKIRKFGQF